MKTPISYYGGKQNMLPYILPLIPPHEQYCEPFAGGAALFWAKPPAPVEALNDTNLELATFYRVAQSKHAELDELVQGTLHCDSDHHFARIVMSSPRFFSDVRIAWAVWVLANQSFSSRLNGNWGYSRKPSESGHDPMIRKVANKKAAMNEQAGNGVAVFAKRLEGVQIDCQDALKVLDRRDSPNTFIYLDPPYFNSNCGHYKGYTEADYSALLARTATLEAKWMLSCYDSEVLRDWLAQHPEFNLLTFNKRLSATVARRGVAKEASRGHKVECVVLNYRTE